VAFGGGHPAIWMASCLILVQSKMTSQLWWWAAALWTPWSFILIAHLLMWFQVFVPAISQLNMFYFIVFMDVMPYGMVEVN
jgi:hypothetical protein